MHDALYVFFAPALFLYHVHMRRIPIGSYSRDTSPTLVPLFPHEESDFPSGTPRGFSLFTDMHTNL